MTLKEFLTTEKIDILNFNIYTFAIVAFIIFLILIITLIIKKRLSFDNGLRAGFMTLSFITFLFAFLYTFTGEYLFAQQANIVIYMFIATISIGLYLGKSLKDLFKT